MGRRGLTPNEPSNGINRGTGFTLVEILVTAALFSFVGLAFHAMMKATQDAWFTTDTQLLTVQATQGVLNRVTTEIKGALPTGLSCTCLSGVGQCLTFTGGDGVAVTYSRTAANELTRAAGAAEPIAIAAGVTDFTPTCNANGLVGVRVTTQATASGGRVFTHTDFSQAFIQNPA